MNDFHRFGGVRQFARNVCAAAALEALNEDIVHGFEISFAEENRADVRPSHAFAAGDLEQFVISDFVAEDIEFVDDFPVAFFASGAHPLQQFGEFRRFRIDEESDDMELFREESCRDFHAGHADDAAFFSLLHKFGQSGDCVMIGERDTLQAFFASVLNDPRRSVGAVRRAAVCV